MGRYFIGLGGLALATFLASVSDARATAIASVRYNGLTFQTSYGTTTDGVLIPFGQTGVQIGLASTTTTLSKIEVGGATVEFATLGPSIRGTATADPGAYALGKYSVSFVYEFTNGSDNDYAFLTVYNDFSAFNPGGPGIGAKVDDSDLEFARFVSYQSGSRLFDSHACDTRVPAYHTFDPPPGTASCGVMSPDSSVGYFLFQNLAAGTSQTASFTLYLELEVSSTQVPAPSPLLLLSGGVLALMGAQAQIRRRRHRAAKSVGTIQNPG